VKEKEVCIMSPQTDLQKKDELRREMRFLEPILEALEEDNDIKKEISKKNLKDRLEDIRKALED